MSLENVQGFRNRKLIVEMAKMFDANIGVDWNATSTNNLLLIIRDNIEHLQGMNKETNHYLDLMCEGHGIAELTTLIGSCDCKICEGNK
tara:strand:- start:37 stop:303 length:267 start_codon:yes stop_codon:yes gene_type:complete